MTLFPELHKFCSQYKRKTGVNQDLLSNRLIQLLGLNPYKKSSYTHIIDLSIHPDYLHRVALIPTSNISESFGNFWNNQIENRNKIPTKITSSDSLKTYYPWTGLGYTYDWVYPKTRLQEENNHEIGLSEFVILDVRNVPTDKISVSEPKTIWEYCNEN